MGVDTIIASIGALVWSLALLGVLEVIGALFIGQLLQPEIKTLTAQPELQYYIWVHFGTWSRAMLTMFEITMAPGGFLKYRSLFAQVYPLFGVFIVFYVCVVTFAVVRVITALFLKATLSTTTLQEMRMQDHKASQRLEYAESLKEKADIDGSGGICQHEFVAMCALPMIREWIEDVDLAPEELSRLY